MINNPYNHPTDPTDPNRILLDHKLFESLCEIMCTQNEIAAIMKVDDETLNHLVKRHYGIPYKEAYAHFAAGGKMSLRRSQFKMSEDVPSMAIWLGKQWLGQKDNPQLEEYSNQLNERMDQMMEQLRQTQEAQGSRSIAESSISSDCKS